MTIDSYTGTIKAEDWTDVSSLTGVTFTNGKTYNLQIISQCQLKVKNAIFDICNEKFDYTSKGENLYIKTGGNSCRLTVLEG